MKKKQLKPSFEEWFQQVQVLKIQRGHTQHLNKEYFRYFYEAGRSPQQAADKN